MKESLRAKETWVCYCLKITDRDIREAIRCDKLRTLADVIRCTGAGDGCTACHPNLMRCLGRAGYFPSSVPICSAK